MARMSNHLAVLASLFVSAALPAAEPPSYAKQVRPFLIRYCVECHNSRESKADLNLETYAGLRAGGKHGAVLAPGNAAESRIVSMVEGKVKPAMPPKKAPQPPAGESSILRLWIDAGAKDDSSAVLAPRRPWRPSRIAPMANSWQRVGETKFF
jgi:hypothetical protein